MRILRLFPLLFIGVIALSLGINLLNNGAHAANVFFKDGLNTLSVHYMIPDVDQPLKGVIIQEKDRHKNELMSEDRFVFVKKNFLSDATDDYQGIKLPILILLGEQDFNVNVQNTQYALRRI